MMSIRWRFARYWPIVGRIARLNKPTVDGRAIGSLPQTGCIPVPVQAGRRLIGSIDRIWVVDDEVWGWGMVERIDLKRADLKAYRAMRADQWLPCGVGLRDTHCEVVDPTLVVGGRLDTVVIGAPGEYIPAFTDARVWFRFGHWAKRIDDD